MLNTQLATYQLFTVKPSWIAIWESLVTNADELMEAFGKEFGVDLATFKHVKHFGPEAWGMSALKKPVQPIKISDLVRAAELHRWPF